MGVNLAQGRVPIRLTRCPMVPTRYKRLTCWTKCKYWDRIEKRCSISRLKGEENGRDCDSSS